MRIRPRLIACCIFFAMALAGASTGLLGSPGGPEPGNLDATAEALRADGYDLELLVSYGTSRGGSAGHLALAIRDEVTDRDVVHSANFYADRSPEHEKGFYTADLVIAVAKKEYLWKTRSSLGAQASFGLDFGETYKRSVIGIRVYGVPAHEKRELTAFFDRVNEDFRARRSDTDYHHGEVVYGYLDLNCAKTIGMAFKQGAGYEDLAVNGAPRLGFRVLKAALTANVPSDMAMKLMRQWDARGYGMDVVLYRKYRGSTYVDPHEQEALAFKDLPDRFPSVLSRDFRRDAKEYRHYDNLYAMNLLAAMTRHVVELAEATGLLEIETRRPLNYRDASSQAQKRARADSGPRVIR